MVETRDRDVIDLTPASEAVETPGAVSAPATGESDTAGEVEAGAESAAPTLSEASALSQDELARLTDDLIAAFKSVYDPEIPVDIYELGLIYKVDVSDERLVTVDMTLTAPGCPVAGEMPGWVENAARKVEGVEDVVVNMVFDPPWDMSRMSDEARLQLNML